MTRRNMARLWLAAAVTLVACGAVRASQEGPFTYRVVRGEFEITDYTEDVAGAVVIPEQIAGIPVTAIGERAFCSKQPSSVSFPSGLKTIGGYAFNRNDLTEIDIPPGVTDIGTRAFIYNSSLIRVSPPEDCRN